MANHCIECSICLTDLRGSGQDLCGWRECPGWIIGAPADLERIIAVHPDPQRQAKARSEQQKVEEFIASAPARQRAYEGELRRYAACPSHSYKDIGGFEVAILQCSHCGHQTSDHY